MNNGEPEAAANDAAFEGAVFEVAECGTLRPLGARDLDIHADLFDISADIPATAERIIDEVELAYPLVVRFQELAQGECDERADELEDLDADERERAEAFISTFDDDPEDAWKGWVRLLDVTGLERCRAEIGVWLAEPIDWHWEEYFPSDAGPEGEALNYFEQLDGETLDAIGVIFVYGDRPGSTYVAAELEGDIDQANASAQALGLDIRFVPAQKISEKGATAAKP